MTPGQRRTNLVVIQPTPFCNLNCNYCYLPDKKSTSRIKPDTISRIAQVVSATILSNPNYAQADIDFVWHAGEPMSLPVKFYAEAFENIANNLSADVKITHVFQTNATLITQEWCNLIKKYNVRMGVSVDGPQHIHDAQRVDLEGKGTFQKVMNGIKMLQNNAIEFGVICVLTKNSLKYPDDIWNFFIENRIFNFGFNSEEVEGAHKKTSLEGLEAYKSWKNFFQRILELKSTTAEKVTVRELDPILKFILGERSYSDERQETTPLRIVSFDYEGNVSTFSPELLTSFHKDFGTFTLANVNNLSTLNDLESVPKFLRINEEIQKGVEECKRTCEYFDVCGGGAPSNKLAENSSFNSTETLYCLLRTKCMGDVVLDFLEKPRNITAIKEQQKVKNYTKLKVS